MNDLSLDTTSQRFCEYATSYLSGLMSIKFFQQLADKLLLTTLQKEKTQISPLLFAALKCASNLPSTPKKLTTWHRKLKGYVDKLWYEEKETETVYVRS